MKLKTRLVLLHTGLMAVVMGLVLGILFSISSGELLSNVQADLERGTARAVEWVEYQNGRLEFDSDLLELENGVYLSVYQPEGELLYGKIPYGFSYGLSFSRGELRKVSSGGTDFYVLDLDCPVEGYGNLVLRGIVSISAAQRDFRYTMGLALALFPVLLLLTAFCGYVLSRRALRPVDRITATVRQIRGDGDLSRRVRLGKGRDEIHTLADTFDSLLDTIEEGVNREKQFADDAAHELRTPVSVILLQCGELLDKGGLDPETEAGLRLIQKKAASMAELLSQLLLLSRADAGRQELFKERLDLSLLVRAAGEEFSGIAAKKGIRVFVEPSPEAFVMGDETLLIRMCGNLLQNAVTYGRENGRIRLGVRQGDGQVELSVKDDGIGISDEALPRIWDRFYQEEPSRSGGGSGLGLSMVKWIVTAHGGKVSVKSKKGEGTEFICTFPAA